MTAFEQLNSYLKGLELRFRLFALSRGAAVVAALALVLTTVLVWISNRYAFAAGVVLPLRILLFLGLAIGISFALAIPLLRLNRRWVTRATERRIPNFEQRLLTLTERPDTANPFTELIAEDALRIARESKPEQLTPTRSFFAFVGTAAATLGVLLWLIMAAPGYWGYGASLLWTGSAPTAHRPLYDIEIQPGDKTIRRKSDQMIGAQLLNFSAKKVTLHARYGGAPKWDETPMKPQRNGSGYQFLFAGLSDPVEYYVQADAAQSKHFNIAVKDLPGVKRVRVALHFPLGLGLKDEVQDPGGDVRAVAGSNADVSVLTDRPLEHGELVLDNGQKVTLSHGEGNWLTARLPVSKDGSYHVAAIDGNETVRISDDYFIESRKDEPPSVKILRPGHDPKVSPIEEVPVTVEAADDFGLNGVDLHYSVNGGAEQVTSLLKSKGTKEASGKTTLYLENFKLAPGDLVSMYATARDARTTSQSDMIFAQAEPFDFTFRQSQQAGGGGGGGAGEQNNNISDRQKEIIAATWNQLRTGSKDGRAIAENAKFLSETEKKLSEQAKTLAERMSSREMVGGNNDFTAFSKAMNQASQDMTTAVDQLKPGKFHDSLPPEQKALQSLLRAESIFRDIQVAFGQSGGGGGGGGGAQRDLARMFDLELDTSKNQYETGQSQDSSGGGAQQKAVDEALQRLKDLAKRQQELAAQAPQQGQAMQQRWEEEQLRREAEQLRQQMEQLAQNSQNGNSQSQSSQGQGQQSKSSQGSSGSQSSSSSSSSRSSQQGSQSGSQQNSQSGANKGQQSGQNQQNAESMREAMKALSRAEEEMRKAVSDRDNTAGRRAASQLAEAENLLNNMQHKQAGNSVGDMANRAQQMANAQRDIANRLKQMYGGDNPSPRVESYAFGGGRGGQMSPNPDDPNAMPQMPDPNARYGRRWRSADPTPNRQPTAQEKALATEKERLAQQLEQLQNQMQNQAQAMAGGQPDVSSKVRKALSDAEQQELALRMEKNAEWLRQGYGERTYNMEDSVTQGLDQLSRQLRDAQQAMKNGNGASAQGDKAAEALAQVRALREQLQNMAAGRGKNSQQGQGQGRDGQNSQNGQSGNSQQASNGSQQGGSQQSGSQQGSSSGGGAQQGGQQGSQGSQGQGGGGGGQRAGGQYGQPGSQRGGQWSPGGANGPYISNDVQSTMRELSNLRNQLSPEDRQLGGYVNGAIDRLGRLNNGQPGLLQDRINQDAVASLERLEVELSRRVGDGKTEGARTGANELAPEKYRDAVAEYFRKLSK